MHRRWQMRHSGGWEARSASMGQRSVLHADRIAFPLRALLRIETRCAMPPWLCTTLGLCLCAGTAAACSLWRLRSARKRSGRSLGERRTERAPRRSLGFGAARLRRCGHVSAAARRCPQQRYAPSIPTSQSPSCGCCDQRITRRSRRPGWRQRQQQQRPAGLSTCWPPARRSSRCCCRRCKTRCGSCRRQWPRTGAQRCWAEPPAPPYLCWRKARPISITVGWGWLISTMPPAAPSTQGMLAAGPTLNGTCLTAPAQGATARR